MHKYTVLCFTYFLLVSAMLGATGSTQTAWGSDPGSAPSKPGQTAASNQMTLKQTRNQVAEIRKTKGLMKTTTDDDRWAAAKRHADRQAKAMAKGEGDKK